jgi:acetolactate synthase-1/2/3 large subunit
MVSTMESAGIEVVAGIPGHTVASLATAVGNSAKIKPFLVRHESIGTFAADVYYRLTGRMMASFTHAFPGLTNSLIGISNAYTDSSTMLVISGGTARAALGRGAYQELSRQFDGDTAQLLRHAVKRVWQPMSALDLVDKTLTAVRTGRSGRPGPVGLDVFQDIWDEEVEVDRLPDAAGYLFPTENRPSADSVDEAAAIIRQAKRPLIVAGNGVLLGSGQRLLRELSDLLQAPVATTLTGKSSFPETHPLSVGVLGWVGSSVANYAARNADVILCLGARLTETTASSWQAGATFTPSQTRIIQADIDGDSIANAYPVAAALVGDIRGTLQCLLDALDTGGGPSSGSTAEWLSALADEAGTWSATVEQSQAGGSPGQIGVGHVVRSLRAATSGVPLTIVCDIGKHHKWIVQQFTATDEDRIISSMGGGAMGFGPAGSIGAALARPDARTICWTGDGGMSMSLPVWLTAAEYNLPITFIVINDQSYGAVANIQRAHYGNTFFSEFNAGGTLEKSYEFSAAAMASAAGLAARTVDDPDDVPEALAWSAKQAGPAVLDIRCDQASVVPSGGGLFLHQYWANRTLPEVTE